MKKTWIILLIIIIILVIYIITNFIMEQPENSVVENENEISLTASKNYCQTGADCEVVAKLTFDYCCAVCDLETVNKTEAARRKVLQSACWEKKYPGKSYVEVCPVLDCAFTQMHAQCVNNKCVLSGNRDCSGREAVLTGELSQGPDKKYQFKLNASTIDGQPVNNKVFAIDFTGQEAWQARAEELVGRPVSIRANITSEECPSPNQQCLVVEILCNILNLGEIR